MTNVTGNKYELVDYFDVWGNEEDGWEVNNLCKEETGIFIAEDSTDEELVEFLKRIGFLNKEVSAEDIEIEGDDFYYEFTLKKNGYPICRLQKEMK